MGRPPKYATNEERLAARRFRERTARPPGSAVRSRAIKHLPNGFRADTVEDIKAIVANMLARIDALPGGDSIPVAKAAASLCQVALRCIELGNIEPRLEALERQIKALRKGDP